MLNLFRHLTDYARSQLTFSKVEKPLKERNLVFGRDCFVAALLAMTMFAPFLASSAFAADDEMTVSVPEYVEINKIGQSLSSDVQVSDSDNCRLENSLHSDYKVNTNHPPILVYISAKVPVKSGQQVSCVNVPKLLVALTKNDSSATAEAVENALSPNPENNANVIVFKGGPSPALNSVYVGTNQGITTYRINNNYGTVGFWIGSVNSSSSVSGTFSPHDSAGVYTATVTVTTIAP